MLILVCKEEEFSCNNNKCIFIYDKCNGYDDCGDNSDETDCQLLCLKDEFLCDEPPKCLNKKYICDGKENCNDGSDEKYCNLSAPKCNKQEFECTDFYCIPNDMRCNNIVDCDDGSDEIDCDEYKCQEFGAMCDDGDCIYPFQICDNVFNCKDFSDEQGCIMNVVREVDINCIYKCDNSCISQEKYCNHLTDCLDKSDESSCNNHIICGNDKLRCDDASYCFKKDEKCDGIYDCLDKSDEKNCDIIHPSCNNEEIYECSDNRKQICFDKYCDNIFDCDDKSDELTCDFVNFIKDIKYQNHNNGVVYFSWNSSKKINNIFFIVYVKNLKNNKTLFHSNTSNFNLYISNHAICDNYLFYIKTNISRVYRKIEYVYHEISTYEFIPYDLKYDYKSNILTWKSHIYDCIGKIFFIECFHN